MIGTIYLSISINRSFYLQSISLFLLLLIIIILVMIVYAVINRPIWLAGGREAVSNLVTQVISIFYLPFASGPLDEDTVSLIQQIMNNNQLVKYIVTSLKYLQDEFLELPLGLLSRYSNYQLSIITYHFG